MKKLILLACLPIAALIFTGFTSTTLVQFMTADWDTAKNKAFAEGKLYFVDFDASYCATCRNMDQSTYMDSRLADYIHTDVVALRVDVQDFDGVMWSQQYEVEALPTMLIFNEKGKLVKRLVGYKSATDLIKEFDAVKTGSSNAAIASTPTTTLNPVPSDKPMTKPTETVVSTTKTTPSGTTITTTTTTSGTAPRSSGSSFMSDPTFDERPVASGKGLFEVSVNRQASNGFSVQVGVFSTYESVLEQAEVLNRKYNKKTLIHIDTYNGSTVYKLLIGSFNSQRDAFYFRNDLRRDGTDGLIKDLRYMG